MFFSRLSGPSLLNLLVELPHARHDLAHLRGILLVRGGGFVDTGREDGEGGGVMAVGMGRYPPGLSWMCG